MKQEAKRKDGYYWCRIKSKWFIFIYYVEFDVWYDGAENRYKDSDFDEIDERRIVRQEN